VISKWGMGHLWSHSLMEVPASYGDRTWTARRVDSATAARWFEAYAEMLVGRSRIDHLRKHCGSG
jgi:hypothetical protein